MGLNQTASAERVHIGFFGLRNAGKSSLVNAITGQETAVVSEVKGTTTDPVKKAMELLPLGPVVIIDTPGLDDEGDLGQKRVARAQQVLNYTDIAVITVDVRGGLQDVHRTLIARLQDKNIPYVIAYNKTDLMDSHPENTADAAYVSAHTGEGVTALKEMLARIAQGAENQKRVVADLLESGDTVVLVVPIDSAAPKGRLILPQQQTIRDILEAGATAVVTRETELVHTLETLSGKPKLVITDSQVFGAVANIVPPDTMLTSFSILFARYKGNLAEAVRGAAQLDKLKDGDTVLISEGCTHHRQCEDIGTVKLPGWVRGYTGREISFEFTSGADFPQDLSPYALVIHCGGCMLNEREMLYRIRHCGDCDTPITNYGIAIAHIHGILRRSLAPFPAVQALLDE